jgi:hypothetical protein
MGFFIRKAFSSEPVRLNLSEGSAEEPTGNTGIRTGLNRKGTYTYGGRHGLYYKKKFLGKGRNHKSNEPSARKDGSIDIFKDTGQTFSPVYDLIEPRKLPVHTEIKGIQKHPLMWLLLLLSLAVPLLLSEPANLFAWTAPGIVLLMITSAYIHHRSWIKKGKHLVESMAETFERKPDQFSVEPMKKFIRKAPEKYVNRFLPDLYLVLIQIMIENPDDRHIFPFNKFEKQIPLTEDFISETKKAALANSLDGLLAVQMLSKDDEENIRELVDKLYLDDRFVFEELQYLNLASTVRQEIESPLNQQNTTVPLDSGEVCYGEYEPVRLLEERVIERFQQDRIPYRKIGFDTELEGKLVLTNRRLILFGEDGSHEFRMNKIVDVITCLEINTTELLLSGRTSPVIFAAPSPLMISGRIEKILQEIVRNQPDNESAG